MTDSDLLRENYVSLEVNDDYSEAVLSMRDGSKLCFRHRVGERCVKAFPPSSDTRQQGTADDVLRSITMFRLNGKHLDLQFKDGSRWEARFRANK